MLLMDAEGITFDRLRKTIDAFYGKRVHVLGDTIVDSLSYTTAIGGYSKTPTPSVVLDKRLDFVGGAAIVAKHLRHAGAEVEFSTVLGQDGLGAWVAEELGQDGIDHHITDDQSRPTTHKNAFVCSDYRLLKVETVANRSISEKQLDYFRADSGHVAA